MEGLNALTSITPFASPVIRGQSACGGNANRYDLPGKKYEIGFVSIDVDVRG